LNVERVEGCSKIQLELISKITSAGQLSLFSSC
jgi:hypothetical protein